MPHPPEAPSQEPALSDLSSSHSTRRDLLVVHSSDVHVDDDYNAAAYGGDGNGGLKIVLDAARRVSADLVLLAGDTFESNRLPVRVLQRTAELLADAGRPVVILPGNHDPMMDESVFHNGRLGDIANVSVLGLTHEVAVHFPHMDLEVWGRAHFDYNDMDPLEHIHPRRARWHIAMAHGHFVETPDRSTKVRPSWLIGDDEITATGADYLALGHWNRPIRVGNGPVPAYYSGSPDYAQTVNLVRLTSDGQVVVTREPV